MVYRPPKRLVWKCNGFGSNKRETGWPHPDTVRRKTELSAEHAVVRIVSEPIALYTGKESAWHPKRAPNAKNSSPCVRRRRNGFCDVPDRLQDNTLSHSDIRKRMRGRLKSQKSQALAIWKSNTPETELGIDLQSQIKILRVAFRNTIKESTTATWIRVTGVVRAQARQASARELCLAQRIKYVQTCLLAKIWYVAQILPPTKSHTQQLTTIRTWYIWQGATFRVPITTLQRQRTQGGWTLTDMAFKRRPLLLKRIWILNLLEVSVTASWLQHWFLEGPIENPPNRNTIPN